MNGSELLAYAIAARLSGDQERVLELFQDSTFHSELAAVADAGDWLQFRNQTYDGWYFVAEDSGYEIYYKERGSAQNHERFTNISDAAAYFFSKVGFIACRDCLPDQQRVEVPASSPARYSGLRLTADAFEALVLALLGAIFLLVAFLIFWDSLRLPNIFSGSFTATISLFCFYSSNRASRHTSLFRYK